MQHLNSLHKKADNLKMLEEEGFIPIIPKKINFTYDSTLLDDCIEKENFTSIIESQELFWLAYSKAFYPLQNKTHTDSFKISIQNKQISFLSIQYIYDQNQKMIENIRKLLKKSLKSKEDLELLVVTSWSDCMFTKETKNNQVAEKFTCIQLVYQNYIKPALTKLAEICGAFYIEDRKKQLIQKESSLPAEIQETEVIRIQWKKQKLTYPIDPIIISDETLDQTFYSLYKKEEFCDFSLVSSDNHLFSIHRIVLYLRGGPVFQAMLTSPAIKETMHKKIMLPEFSQDIVQHFVDFIYLGGTIFFEKFSSTEQRVDLFGLFIFANLYQQKKLIDCCTNLISLFVSEKDLENIKYFGDLYKNEHLKELYTHYTIGKTINKHDSQKGKTIFKV